MGYSFPTPKTLTLLALALLCVFTVAWASVASAYTSSWWTSTQSVTTVQKELVYTTMMDSTQRSYVDAGHDYIAFTRSNGSCYVYVNTTLSAEVTLRLYSSNSWQILSTGSFYYNYYNSGNCETYSTPTATGTVSATNSTTLSKIIISKISTVNYDTGYTLSDTPTVSEINSQTEYLSIPPTTYDDLISTSNSPRVSYPYLDNKPHQNVTGHTNDRCHDTNFNQPFNNWYSLFTSKVYGMTDSSQKTEALGFIDYLDDAIQGVGGGWGVLHDYSEDGDYHRTIIMTWTGTPTLEFVEVSGVKRFRFNGSNNSLRYYTITPQCSIFDTSDPPPDYGIGTMSQPSSGDLFLDNIAVSSLSVGSNTHTPVTRAVVFLSGQYNITYPDGYEGAIISDAMPVDEYYSHTFTDFDVHMNAFSVTATYRGNEYDDPRCTYINWRYVLVDGPEDIYDPDEVQQAYTRMGQDLHTVAPESGFYRIDAMWSWASTPDQISQAGLNSADLAHCQSATVVGSGYISEAYQNGELPMNTGKVFPVDGISTEVYSFSLNRNCYLDEQDFVVSGFYPPSMVCIYETSWTLEDCSTYGLDDLHLKIGCEIANFTKQLRATLIAFFVPAPSKISAIFQSLVNDIQNQSSFLTYPMHFIIQTMNSTMAQNASCQMNTGSFFGTSSDWDLCRLKHDWPTAWEFATTIFRMAVVLLFIMAIYKVFNNLWRSESE